MRQWEIGCAVLAYRVPCILYVSLPYVLYVQCSSLNAHCQVIASGRAIDWTKNFAFKLGVLVPYVPYIQFSLYILCKLGNWKGL